MTAMDTERERGSRARASPLSVPLLLGVGVALLAMVFYFLVESPDRTLVEGITIISKEPALERYLKPFHAALGPDLKSYRGHLYRVLSYTLHYLHGDRTHIQALCAALVYHDIGLWTSSTLAYIEPSCSLAEADLSRDSRLKDPETAQLIHDLIYYHHKLTPFRGPHADVVNAMRKADWIDATRGVLAMGMPREHIVRVAEKIPFDGFHETLLNFGPRLHGNKYLRMLKDISTIFKL